MKSAKPRDIWFPFVIFGVIYRVEPKENEEIPLNIYSFFIRRMSHRTSETHNLYGLVGEVCFEGKVCAGRKTHEFGLGKYEILKE